MPEIVKQKGTPSFGKHFLAAIRAPRIALTSFRCFLAADLWPLQTLFNVTHRRITLVNATVNAVVNAIVNAVVNAIVNAVVNAIVNAVVPS